MSTQPGKDTIYIDVDDEITAIIDKVRGSHEKILALVLPKRATVLQSIVNMKLLKRTADEAKKHLVLITSEAGLLPLAGNVGMYVAKTLQSKPEIPTASAGHDGSDDQEEAVNMADDLDSSSPVAEHMRHAPASVISPTGAAALADEDEAIELDNSTATPSASLAAATAAKKPKKGGKKFNIPDFNKFKVWGVIAGAALVSIIFLWYIGFVVMPRANISVKTDSTAIQQSLDVRFSTTASSVDLNNNTVPAQSQQTQKTVTQQAATTGQKDNGTKASGSISMTAGPCTGSAPNDVPAGTGVSSAGLTFITQDNTTFTPSFSKNKTCSWVAGSPTGITASANGTNYNIAPGNYTVAGRSDISASGGATTGGTSQIVKVVTQADIDGLKQKIATQDTASIKTELQQGLTGKGLFAVDGTFANADPEVITNVNVGDQADTVTITQKTTYTMMGAKQADLQKIVGNVVNKKIDTSKQQILDYGLGAATFKLVNQTTTSTLTTMDVTAVAGTDINLDDIKKQIAGKKSADAKQIIGNYPGVTDVTVNYSPFWVSSIPKKASKINVTVEKPTAKNAN